MVDYAGLAALSPGYTQGQMDQQNLKLKQQQVVAGQMAVDAAKRDLQALAASVSMPGVPAPQPPAPGQPSQPMTQPSAPPQQQPPMAYPQQGQIMPMPQAQPGPIDVRPPPTGQPGPTGAPQQQPPAQMQPTPQQQGPVSAPPSTAPTPGGTQPSDFYQQSANVLQTIAQDIKRNNPGIDNLTLATAMQKRIEMLQSVDPGTKAALTLQMQLMKAQLDYQVKLQRAETAQDAMEATRDYHEGALAVAGGRLDEARTHNRNTEDQRERGLYSSGGSGKTAAEKRRGAMLQNLDTLEERARETHSRAYSVALTQQARAAADRDMEASLASIKGKREWLMKGGEIALDKPELPEGGKVQSQKTTPQKNKFADQAAPLPDPKKGQKPVMNKVYKMGDHTPAKWDGSRYVEVQ